MALTAEIRRMSRIEPHATSPIKFFLIPAQSQIYFGLRAITDTEDFYV